MEYQLHYLIIDENNNELADGKAIISLEKEYLTLKPKLGSALLVSYRDLISVKSEDYKIKLALDQNNCIIITKLGYQYDTFLKNLTGLRNEIILQDLLMYESLRKSGYTADVYFKNAREHEVSFPQSELRLYETALVVLPPGGELIRVPYGTITSYVEEDYQLKIHTDKDESLVFIKMGEQFSPFVRELNNALNHITLTIQTLLKEMLPGLNPLSLQKVSGLLKEGKAAQCAELENLTPGLWAEMESRLKVAGIREEYDYLSAMGLKHKISIGIKRSLMGDVTGEYIWFMVPILSCLDGNGGNVIAIEAGSTEGSSRATYFFRLVERGNIQGLEFTDTVEDEIDDSIRLINQAMLQINFRREPIYLSDKQLNEPNYERYKYAINRIPELKEIRSRYIGRVFHYNFDQWTRDVRDLLTYNWLNENDELKWQKSMDD